MHTHLSQWPYSIWMDCKINNNWMKNEKWRRDFELCWWQEKFTIMRYLSLKICTEYPNQNTFYWPNSQKMSLGNLCFLSFSVRCCFFSSFASFWIVEVQQTNLNCFYFNGSTLAQSIYSVMSIALCVVWFFFVLVILTEHVLLLECN